MIKNTFTYIVTLAIFFTNISNVLACPVGTNWVSTSILRTLLADSPALEVTFESTELKINSNGRINLSAEGNIQSITGDITMTGEAVLKARGRYILTSRGNRNFIKITSVRSDIFTTRLFINGVLASENDYTDVFFGDREIQYRCIGNSIRLIENVDGERRVLRFNR
jgi:hypothetical protein